MPMLSEALAHIECEVVEQVVGGTHTVFLARRRPAEANAGQPLTYFRGFWPLPVRRGRRGVPSRVRDQVLSRVYPPDHTILVEDLSRALGVERSAAFYALTRLASDGLVRRDLERVT